MSYQTKTHHFPTTFLLVRYTRSFLVMVSALVLGTLVLVEASAVAAEPVPLSPPTATTAPATKMLLPSVPTTSVALGANDTGVDGEENPIVRSPRKFEIGVGLFGGAGVTGLTKPASSIVTIGGQQAIDPTYPGFFGPVGGMGLMLDVRAFGVIGLEADLYYSFSDKGKGDLTFGSQTFVIEIGQSALHLPILLKATLPFGPVRPFLGIGPELVFPGQSSLAVTPAVPSGSSLAGATASTYVLLTAAIGAEIRLPLKKLDVRIPFSLRFGKNFATGDNLADRRTSSVSSTGVVSNIAYKSEWELQGLFTLGGAIYF
jgi:hypothetical protein